MSNDMSKSEYSDRVIGGIDPSRITYESLHKLRDMIDAEIDLRLHMNHHSPANAPAGEHPFEMCLKNRRIQLLLGNSAEDGARRVFNTLSNCIATPSDKSRVSPGTQLDMLEHVYSASRERLSAALVIASGKRNLLPPKHYLDIEIDSSQFDEDVVDAMSDIGWLLERRASKAGVLYSI